MPRQLPFLDPQTPNYDLISALRALIPYEHPGYGKITALHRMLSEADLDFMGKQPFTRFIKGKRSDDLDDKDRNIIITFLQKHPTPIIFPPRGRGRTATAHRIQNGKTSLEQRLYKPPTKNHGEILLLLRHISTILVEHIIPILNQYAATYTTEDLSILNQGGISRIDGDRWGISLSRYYPENFGFEFLCKTMIGMEEQNIHHDLVLLGYTSTEIIRESLMKYATTMATRDSRVSQSWYFENYSLIVQSCKTHTLPPHIDLLLPYYQFALIISDQVPATYTYQVVDGKRINTPEDLVEYLGIDINHSGIPKAMKESTICSEMFNNYGACLSTLQPGRFKIWNCNAFLQPGTLLSTPGSVLHAEPGWNEGLRAVLFFTGRPSDATEQNYPPTKIFHGVLLGRLLLHLWESIHDVDKRGLLVWLAQAVEQYPKLHCHFINEPKLQKLILELKKHKKTQQRNIIDGFLAMYSKESIKSVADPAPADTTMKETQTEMINSSTAEVIVKAAETTDSTEIHQNQLHSISLIDNNNKINNNQNHKKGIKRKRQTQMFVPSKTHIARLTQSEDGQEMDHKDRHQNDKNYGDEESEKKKHQKENAPIDSYFPTLLDQLDDSKKSHDDSADTTSDEEWNNEREEHESTFDATLSYSTPKGKINNITQTDMINSSTAEDSNNNDNVNDDGSENEEEEDNNFDDHSEENEDEEDTDDVEMQVDKEVPRKKRNRPCRKFFETRTGGVW